MHLITGLRDPGASFSLRGSVDDSAERRRANRAVLLSAVGLALTGLIELVIAAASGSAALLGDALDARRDQLRETLPIRRVIGPADVAALAVHLMTNTALTGATYDIDGGQQLVAGA